MVDSQSSPPSPCPDQRILAPERTHPAAPHSGAHYAECSGRHYARTFLGVGGVFMGAPQIVDGLPSQTTGRERILPVMRYLHGASGSDRGISLTA